MLFRRRLLLLLVLEARDGVDDVLYLLRRRERHSVLVHLLSVLLVVLFIPVELLLLLEILIEILAVLRHPVEVKLLILPIGRVSVALLGARLLIEHAVEIHIHLRVLRLQLAQHVLDIAHNSLQVDEVGVLTILAVRLRMLLRVLLCVLLRVLVGVVLVLVRLRLRRVVVSIHVRESVRLRRISLARPPLLLLLLLDGPVHKVVIVVLPPPGLLLHIVVAISWVTRVTWMSLLSKLLVGVELSSNFLDFVVGLDVVVAAIVHKFIAVVLALIIVILTVHAWTRLVPCVLVACRAHILARADYLRLRVVRL